MLKNYLKNKIISIKYKVKIGDHSTIGYTSIFEGKNSIGSNTVFDGFLGRGSYIGSRAWVERAYIGRYSSIANGVTVAIGRHPKEMVSQHTMFYSTAKQNGYTYSTSDSYDERKYADTANKYDVVIGNDVWVGAGATILGGVTIGNGAVIGAGAVVTRNIPDYAIVVGVPAKVVKYRFSKELIEAFLEFKWWSKTEEWLTTNVDLFKSPERFLKLTTKLNGEENNE